MSKRTDHGRHIREQTAAAEFGRHRQVAKQLLRARARHGMADPSLDHIEPHLTLRRLRLQVRFARGKFVIELDAGCPNRPAAVRYFSIAWRTMSIDWTTSSMRT